MDGIDYLETLPHGGVDNWIDTGVDEGDEMENDANKVPLLREIRKSKDACNLQPNRENEFGSPTDEEEENDENQHLNHLKIKSKALCYNINSSPTFTSKDYTRDRIEMKKFSFWLEK